MTYRRSRTLIASWHDGRCRLTNYATGMQVELVTGILEVLHHLNEWVTDTELAVRTGYGEADTHRILAALVKATLVDRSERVPPDAPSPTAWDAWGSAAEFFHFSTRNTRFNDDISSGERRLIRKAAEGAVPQPVRRTTGPRTPLQAAVSTSPLGDVLQRRRTWRTFSTRPVDVADVARLLKLTVAVQHWATCVARGPIPLKTAPSGGACHPIETFVAACRVRGLAPALYHYDAAAHELVLVNHECTPATLASFIPGQPWFAEAPLLLIFAASFERTSWRYPVPKAYRNVLLEAGHVCQTFCLTATEMGLAPFCTQAIAEDAIATALGLDGVREDAVYVAGCGHPPPDGWSLGLPPL